jgi:hypothetical protein
MYCVPWLPLLLLLRCCQVNYHKDLVKATTGQEWRSDMQPINITQPQGPSFSIEGNLVSAVLAAAGRQQQQGCVCPVLSGQL